MWLTLPSPIGSYSFVRLIAALVFFLHFIPDQHCRSCIRIGGSAVSIRLFQTNYAFSHFELFDKLVVATSGNDAFGFGPMAIAIGQIFFTLPGFVLSVYITLATSDASLNRLLLPSICITPSLTRSISHRLSLLILKLVSCV